MMQSPALALLADLNLYEDAMRAAADAPHQATHVREADALAHGLRTHLHELPQLGAIWNRFADSHAQTLTLFEDGTSHAQRLDALERHVEVMLELQRQCLATFGGGP
jgi:hypothetical protein